MIVRTLLVAQLSSLDMATNNVSLFNVLEEVNGVSLPVVIPSIQVFCLLEKTEGEIDEVSFSIKIQNNDQLLGEFPVKANFEGKKRSRLFLDLNSVVIPRPGKITFELIQDGAVKGEWWVDVNVREMAVVNVAPTPLTKTVPVR